MASITIRNPDDSRKARLRVQAAVHGRSMEDEARAAAPRQMIPLDTDNLSDPTRLLPIQYYQGLPGYCLQSFFQSRRK